MVDTPSYWNYSGDSNQVSIEEYLAIMPDIKVEYKHPDSGLAIISFKSNNNYPAAPVAKSPPKKGDRIALISNPEGEK